MDTNYVISYDRYFIKIPFFFLILKNSSSHKSTFSTLKDPPSSTTKYKILPATQIFYTRFNCKFNSTTPHSSLTFFICYLSDFFINFIFTFFLRAKGFKNIFLLLDFDHVKFLTTWISFAKNHIPFHLC